MPPAYMLDSVGDPMTATVGTIVAEGGLERHRRRPNAPGTPPATTATGPAGTDGTGPAATRI